MLIYVLNIVLVSVWDEAVFGFIKNLRLYFNQPSLNRMINYDIADDYSDYLPRFSLKSESLQDIRVKGEI